MIHYLSETSHRALRGVALLRLDFNTEDDWRMRAVLPTVKFLLTFASKMVIVSHEGRPKGFDKSLSLRNKAKDLKKMLKRKVIFVPRFDFPKIHALVLKSPTKSIFVLENIRFLKSESTKKPELAKQLAKLADYYVNDAFAVSHRSSDSVAKIEKFLPSYAGLELEEELKFLSHVLEKPKHPLVLILGGSKAADKLGVIENFLNKADAILLGGAAANTMLFLKGVDVGNSLIDKDKKDLERLGKLLKYKNLILPVDFKFLDNAIVDVGAKTAAEFEKIVSRAKTVIWSGPLGLIEKKPYDCGTLAIAKAVVKNRRAFSLAGGGETVMFLKKYKLDKKFSFISTGGGAMLEFLAGEKLPGVEALKHSPSFAKASAGKKKYVK